MSAQPAPARTVAVRAAGLGGTGEDGAVSERGTRGTFEEFVTTRSGGLLRTAYLLTQDSQLAEDLLQTALAKAWRAWGRVESSPDAYVRKILVNTYATWWRRRWNGEHPTDDLPDTEHHSDDAAGSSTTHDVRTALARLPRHQRAVVVLRFFEDLSEAETARLLECSVGTVKSQSSKALAKLRVDPTLAVIDDDPQRGRDNEGVTR